MIYDSELYACPALVTSAPRPGPACASSATSLGPWNCPRITTSITC